MTNISDIRAAHAARDLAVDRANAFVSSLKGSPTAAEERTLLAFEAEVRSATENIAAVTDNAERAARFGESLDAMGYAPAEDRSNIDQAAETFLREARRDIEHRTAFGGLLEARSASALFAGAAGANSASSTVPRTIDQIIESRISIAGLIDAGLSVHRSTSGEDRFFPYRASRSAFARVNEGQTIPKSNPTVSGVTLKAYKYAAIAQASVELLADSATDVVSLIGRSFGDSADVLIERLVVTGSDGTNAITGGMVEAAAGHELATAAAFDADDVIDAYHALPQSYRRDAVWLVNGSTVAALRRLKDAEDRYMWGTLADGTGTLMGRPVLESPFVPELGTADASVAVFGVPSAYTLRVAGGLAIVRSDEYGYAEDVISWKCRLRLDGAVTDPEGLVTVRTP
jgi:HK97 family phage major capsid protein